MCNISSYDEILEMISKEIESIPKLDIMRIWNEAEEAVTKQEKQMRAKENNNMTYYLVVQDPWGNKDLEIHENVSDLQARINELNEDNSQKTDHRKDNIIHITYKVIKKCKIIK